MQTKPARFRLDPSALVDLATGLCWAPRPAPLASSWADAVAAAERSGQRLPTVTELMTLLVGLDPDFAGIPAPGERLWSTSGSPFSPASSVRAIACEPSALFAVVVLERSEEARWWGVQLRTEHRSVGTNAPGFEEGGEPPRPEETK